MNQQIQPTQQPNIPQEPQQPQPSPQPTPQPTIQPGIPQKQGLPTWIIIVIVVGAIVVLAGASYGAYWYFASQSTEPSPTDQGGIIPGQLPSGELDDETADWQAYTNEEYGFEVRYPENWATDKISQERSVIFYKSNAPKDFYGNIVPVIIIEVKDNTQQLPVNQWIENNKGNLVSKEGSEMVDGIEGSKIIEKGIVDYLVVYTGKDRIMYRISIPKDSEYLAVFNQILSTFKFIEVDETADWQTYRNEKYRYEIKYPGSWQTTYGFEVIQSIGDEEVINFADPNNMLNWVSVDVPLGVNIPIENSNNIKINNINFYKSTYGSGSDEELVVFFAIDKVGTYRFLFSGFYGENSEEFYRNILSTFKFIE